MKSEKTLKWKIMLSIFAVGSIMIFLILLLLNGKNQKEQNLSNNNIDKITSYKELQIKQGAALIDEFNRDWIGRKTELLSGRVVKSEDFSLPTEEKIEVERQRKRRDILKESNGLIQNFSEDSISEALTNTFYQFPVTVKADYYVTPEIIFNTMFVFTAPTGEGWKLKKGQKLTFTAEQYPISSEEGQTIAYGYIVDHTLHFPMKDLNSNIVQQYTISAKTSGEYYIVLKCESIDPISLKRGTIDIK